MNLFIRSRHSTHDVLRNHPELTSDQRILYRLGSTTELRRRYDIEINPISAIRNSMDKRAMKKCFDTANVKHCAYVSGNEILREHNLKFPIVAKAYNGSRNRGNTKLDDASQLSQFISTHRDRLNNYIFEEFFNSAREYRLHVNKNGCFYSCRKLRTNDTPSNQRWFFNNSNCVWITQYNLREGITPMVDSGGNPWKKKAFNEPQTWKEIEQDCVKALKSTGLDFGAFDVRVNSNGDWKIIEVNSAPSFGGKTGLHYIQELKKIIKNRAK